MARESTYAKKFEELGKPYKAKSKLYKNIGMISFVLMLACLMIAVFVYEYRVYAALGLVFFTVLGLIMVNQTIHNSAKSNQNLCIADAINDFAKYYDFDDFDYNELDRILEDMDNGIYSVKIADQMITFTPNLIVTCVEFDKRKFYEICKMSCVTQVVVRDYDNEVSFDFDDVKGSAFSFDYDRSQLENGKEGFVKLLKSHYPELKISMDSNKRK